MKRNTNRMFSKAAMTLLLMLLTTVTAWATDVTVYYTVSCSTMQTPHKSTIARSDNQNKKVTWDFGVNWPAWSKDQTHGVDDEYDITFKPDADLSTMSNSVMVAAGTTFTVSVGTSDYYIKSVQIGSASATAGLNAKSLDVNVSSTSTLAYFTVILTTDHYRTVTPASGLTVTSGTTAVEGNVTYYKVGTTVTIAPTNAHHIIDGTGGTGSASVTIAADKRSFSFTMPSANVSPTATLTEVYQLSPASGITLSPAAYFTYSGAQYYKPGTVVTLSSTIPTGQHVTYKVGNTNLPGNTYTVTSSDVSFSRVLAYNTYSVQFNGNGNTGGSMSNQDFTYGTAQNLTANAFSRTGYTFAGWATSDNGNVVYADKASVSNLTATNGGTVTLYAKWTANTYSVQFNGNGHTGGSMSNQGFTYDAAPKSLTANAFTRAFTVTYHYNGATGGNSQTSAIATSTFNGWATSASGAKVYNNQQSVSNLTTTNNGTFNLYAKWTDGSVTLPTPVKTGYTFAGWYSDAGLTDKVGDAGASYTPSANIPLYAKWNITYHITYNLNDGSVATSNPTTYNVESETFQLNNPTKPGYTFIGWTGANGETPQLKVTITKGSTEDRTYNANYEFARITVGSLTYECTSATEAKVIACDNSATFVTIPTTVSNNDGTYNVTAIEATAFSGCTSLNMLISSSETPQTLGSGAFDGCTALGAIGVPAGTAEAYKVVTGWSAYNDKIFAIDGTCGTNVFYSYNSSTKTLDIFGTGAISSRPWSDYCSEITTIVIGNGVTSIGEGAFLYCTNLESVTIPASVTSIGNNAFYGCTNLESVTIPASVKSIGNLAFNGCNGLTSVEILNGVTSIGNSAFNDCTNLESVTIPASVTSIGEDAFYGCNGLTSVEILNGVKSIGNLAFNECTGLESVTIPASVTSIGNLAFNECTGLKDVTIYAPALNTYGHDAFVDNAAGRKIYVFSDCVDTYKAGWSQYASDILPIEGIALADKADNSSLIAAANGNKLDVTLQGRTLYKDGAWNTLCLPFDMTISGSLLDGADIRTLSGSDFDSSNGTLTLNFTPETGEGAVSSIEAGKPYIVKWNKPDGYDGHEADFDITNPVFYNVTVSTEAANVTTGNVDFIGITSPHDLDANDATALYLGADNLLYYPGEAMTIGACRAYFQLNIDNLQANIRQFLLNFDGEGTQTTGIAHTETAETTQKAEGWYTLDGRRLNGKPTTKGVYLHGGKKVLVK